MRGSRPVPSSAKRYVNGDGSVEVLCLKPGDGSLSVGDDKLAVKDAKKLPKTD